jgi:hypothetical protein
MSLITLTTGSYQYDSKLKTIHISEKGIPFATEYSVLNPRTKNRKQFKFSHSTGPEFEPTTRWVYKNDEGFILEVHNDAEITKKSAQDYLQAKTR